MEGLIAMAVLTIAAIGIRRAYEALFLPKPVPRVEHDVLGTLVFDPDVHAWRTVVETPHGGLGFLLAGRGQPDERLVAHAVDLVRGAKTFLETVQGFLEEEAKREPRWTEEVRGLVLKEVCLFWPKRPDDGMLYFSGPTEDLRIWRSDYRNRRPRGLGFDS